MSNYGAMTPGSLGGADEQRSRLAAIMMEGQRGGPMGAPAIGLPVPPKAPPPPPPSQQGAPQGVPPAAGMPQAQPAATGATGPPQGPFGTAAGGPMQPGLMLPGVPPPGQPLPLRY